jgi:DNA-binding MarR family transcriptional regulator
MTTTKDLASSEGREVLLEEIMGGFGEVMRHVAVRHVPDFLAVDVTMSQAKTLYLVAAQPGVRMTALAAQLGVSLSTVSGLVDRLVEHGYVERREDPDDRRQQLVRLTSTGDAVIERMREMNLSHMRLLLEGLSVPELEAFSIAIKALGRRAAALDRQRDAANAAPATAERKAR